jgi:hypothetical protein
MGFGFILDDLRVFIGVIVVWFARGCKYGLWRELKTIKAGDFFRRREGIIGLATILVVVGLVWASLRLL